MAAAQPLLVRPVPAGDTPAAPGRAGGTPATPATPGRPQLRVVPAPPRYRTVVLIGVLLVGGVFGIVALNAAAAKHSFAARALQTEVGDLTVLSDELAAQVAALEAPRRVREVATEELGMVPARNPAVVVLDEPMQADPVAAPAPLIARG